MDQLKEVVATYGVWKSLRLCGRSWTIAPNGEPTPRFCRNRWACPTCSPYYLEKDFLRIAPILQASSGVLSVTLTLGQTPGSVGKQAFDRLQSVWLASLMKGEWFTRFRNRTAMRGYVRAIECTFSENGFHPHIHAAFVFDNVPAHEVGSSLLTHYVSTAHQLGIDASLSAQHAHRVQSGEARERVSFYMTEQDAIRRSRANKGRGPGDLLHNIVDKRDPSDILRLQEFHRAIKGRRKISTSANFWNLIH